VKLGRLAHDHGKSPGEIVHIDRQPELVTTSGLPEARFLAGMGKSE
jgi:hypothetical protein